jgi:hypothetical protein
MSNICKATITYGDVKIVVEGPKEFVEGQITKYAPHTHVPSTSKQADKFLLTAGDSAPSPTNLTSERELIAAKQPRGHHEIVAVLAFSLTENGQAEFGEEEIRRAYIRAGVRPPKVVAQALIDAKRKHDFLEPVGRGRYRLSSHGDRTVRFDLPRREGD